ncbi:MAG: outer membrane immunogenic protein [Shewanella sp.]|jgi:outer membrane immunogenic protein
MNKLLLAGGVLFTLLQATSASAAPDIQGYYIGGMGGYSELSLDEFTESAASYGGYAGYSFGKDLAVESTFFTTANLADEGDVTARTATFAAKLNHFFSPTYSMFIKVGVATTEVSAGVDDYSASGWMWGAGFNMAITDNVNIRLGYEAILTELAHDSSDDVLDSDLANLYLGVNYQF